METAKRIRHHILEEYLPGEDPSQLGDDDDLIGSGILDSLAVVRLVSYLEDVFGIRISPGEITPANLGSVRAIADLVRSRRDPGGMAA